MKIVIDRIEGEIAVCELPDMKIVNIPLCLFENVKEGDVYSIEKDETEREARVNKAQSLFDKLVNRD